MKHKGMWVLLITVGVFLGVVLYGMFTNYLVQKEMEEFVEKQQIQTEQTRKKHAAERERRKAAELYKNTACGINEDTGRCSCIHEKTGQKISLAQDECKKRARQIT